MQRLEQKRTKTTKEAAVLLLNIPLGLLINFHEMKLTDAITRMLLPGANA
jgi:hypothetical protein